MTLLLAPVIACHHWISVCATAVFEPNRTAPAASQPNLLVFIVGPPWAPTRHRLFLRALALPHYSRVAANLSHRRVCVKAWTRRNDQAPALRSNRREWGRS